MLRKLLVYIVYGAIPVFNLNAQCFGCLTSNSSNNGISGFTTPVKIYPLSNSITAIQMCLADGSTCFWTADSSNKRIIVGTNSPTSDDSAILGVRAATNPLSAGGSHLIRDESTYISSGADGGYASFDSIPIMSGALAYNHLRSFQARPNYSGSTSVNEISNSFQLTHNGSGTATSVYGFHMMDALGVGPITVQYGIWCDAMTRGASNYCFYSPSMSLPSYHGGLLQFGTAPRISASGWTTYGSILTHDTIGQFITNPFFTLINGVVTMSYTTAKVLASATNLQLESTSGTVLIRPGGATVGTYSSTGLVVTGIIKPSSNYQSSDGTAGVTVTTCTGFKNGLCISGT